MSAYETAKQAILGIPYDPNKKPSPQLVVQAFKELQDQVDALETSGALGYPNYETTTAGLAAVSEGESFTVLEQDYLVIYKDVSGVATQTGRIALDSAISNLIAAETAAREAADAAETAAREAADAALAQADADALAAREAADAANAALVAAETTAREAADAAETAAREAADAAETAAREAADAALTASIAAKTLSATRRLRGTTGGPDNFTTVDNFASDWEADAIYTIVFPQKPNTDATISVSGRNTIPLLDRSGIDGIEKNDIKQGTISYWQYDAAVSGLRLLNTPHRYETYTDQMINTFPFRLTNESGSVDAEGYVSEYTATDPNPSTTLNNDNALFVWRPNASNQNSPSLTVTSHDGLQRTTRKITTRTNFPLQKGDLLGGSLYILCFNPVSLTFQILGDMTERVRRDVENLSQNKRDKTDFEPVATIENDGFMSSRQVAQLNFVSAQVENLNTKPTNITASNVSYSELHVAGDSILEFFVTDATPGDVWEWSFTPNAGPDNSDFTIQKGTVEGRAFLSLAGNAVAGVDKTVSIRVQDSGGLFFDKEFILSCIAVRGSLNAITEKWIAKIPTEPTAQQITAMDRFVSNAISPISSKLLQVWYDKWSDEVGGLVNIIDGKYNNRIKGNMNHISNFGWKSDGFEGGLSSGWIPDLDGNFLMREAAAIGNVVENVKGNAAAFGCSNQKPWQDATNRFWYVIPSNFSNRTISAIGHNADGALGALTVVESDNAKGLWAVNRTGINGPSTVYKSRPDTGETSFTEIFSNNVTSTFPPVSEFMWCRAGNSTNVDAHMMNFGLIAVEDLTLNELNLIALEFKLLEEVFADATGVLTIEDNYPNATAYANDSLVIDAQSVEPTIVMRARPNRRIENGGGWWHPRIRINNALNKRPVFEFRNREPGYPNAHLDISRPSVENVWFDSGWYSYDQIEWFKMGLASYEYDDPDHGKTTIFQNDTPFEQDLVYFASKPDFPAYRWQDWLTDNYNNSVIHNTGQSLTPAAVDHEKFTIVNTTPFTDTIGRPVASFPVHLFEVRDDSLSNPDGTDKRIVFLTSGNHPGETQHSWNLLGFLEWVISSEVEAVEYRKRFRTLVLPYANPHALEAGYERVDPLNLVSGSTTTLRDSNRGWNDNNFTENAAKLKPKLLAQIASMNSNSLISIGADFHEFAGGSANYYWNSEIYSSDFDDDFASLWQAELQQIGSDYVVRSIPRTGAYLTSNAAAERALFIDAFDATWAMTPEQGPILGQNTDDFKKFGKALGRAYLRMYQNGMLPERDNT